MKQPNTSIFEYVVTNKIWVVLSMISEIDYRCSFDTVGRLWVCNKKFECANVLTSATWCSLWKPRNDLCIYREKRRNVHVLFRKIINMIKSWTSLCSTEQSAKLTTIICKKYQVVGPFWVLLYIIVSTRPYRLVVGTHKLNRLILTCSQSLRLHSLAHLSYNKHQSRLYLVQVFNTSWPQEYSWPRQTSKSIWPLEGNLLHSLSSVEAETSLSMESI